MLLNKTLRSSTLKLAFFYVIGFSSAIFSVLGFVYWNTVAYVSAEADRSIAAEGAALRKIWAASGRGGLIELPKPPRFRPGDKVRVLYGPLIGVTGLYAGMRPRERVEVLLAILGGSQRVTLAADAVEAAN